MSNNEGKIGYKELGVHQCCKNELMKSPLLSGIFLLVKEWWLYIKEKLVEKC